ncbi:MAG: hypothetical protein LBJ14_07405 [Desulfarculales bacterium]|jgi:hypothetical protein|nr:hypothetical protein [Desulfarculales bacterium]
MSILAKNAKDIILSDADLCLVLGYMATPNRVGYIEAQIPADKVHVFLREFPNAPYYPITQGETSGGNVMKQGCQLRIYLNNIYNCPPILTPLLGIGTGKFVKRINKGRFVERVVKDYGFAFGQDQSEDAIRSAVNSAFPRNVRDFEVGYKL